jgi:membrane-bound inhibitor of C-type lysozyme
MKKLALPLYVSVGMLVWFAFVPVLFADSCSYTSSSGGSCSTNCPGAAFCGVGEGGYVSCYCSGTTFQRVVLKTIITEDGVSEEEFVALQQDLQQQKFTFETIDAFIRTYWKDMLHDDAKYKNSNRSVYDAFFALQLGNIDEFKKHMTLLRKTIADEPSYQKAVRYTIRVAEQAELRAKRLQAATLNSSLVASFAQQSLSLAGQRLSNYPNPVTSTTTIAYQLTQKEFVTINIYDVTGTLVKKLISTVQDAGEYVVDWDGSSTSGSPVASGVYIYRLETASMTISKQMTVVR